MPSADDADALEDESGSAQPAEPFYRGTLIQLSRGGGRGIVRSQQTGREIPFEREHVVVLAPREGGGWFELREGMAVGYDVGWTSHGLRVTKLFPAPAAPRPITAEDPSGT